MTPVWLNSVQKLVQPQKVVNALAGFGPVSQLFHGSGLPSIGDLDSTQSIFWILNFWFRPWIWTSFGLDISFNPGFAINPSSRGAGKGGGFGIGDLICDFNFLSIPYFGQF